MATSLNFLPARQANGGLTLVELTMVMLIIGLILGLGIAGFQTLLHSQRLASTRSSLEQARQCLLRRMLFSDRYPGFSDDLTCAPPVSDSVDVDACLCLDRLRDAWNRPFRFIEAPGLAAPPAGDGPLRGQVRVAPPSTCLATSHTGESLPDIAFLLISYGEDGLPGDPSYGSLFSSPADLAATMDCTSGLDFTNKGDDLYLVVTSRELATYLRR